MLSPSDFHHTPRTQQAVSQTQGSHSLSFPNQVSEPGVSASDVLRFPCAFSLSREMEEQFRSICRTEVEKKQRDGEVTFVLWSAFLFCGSLISLLLSISLVIHLIVYTIPLNFRGKPLISWGMDAFTALQWKYPSIMMLFVP